MKKEIVGLSDTLNLAQYSKRCWGPVLESGKDATPGCG